MEKLELKHLAPYLPYGLKVQYIGELDDNNKRHDSSYIRISEIAKLGSVEFRFANPIYWMDFKRGYFGITSFEFKPILRPLSDLTKEELINAGFDYQIDWLTHEREYNVKRYESLEKFINKTDFGHVQYLISQHYDIYGLIPKVLAIDINTLNQEL